jgi:tRNA (guanine10-N2)-methyltransferase
VEGLGRTIPLKEQLEVIEMFNRFPLFDSQLVDLKTPELVFKVVEDSNRVYCGIQVASSRVNGETYYSRYNLKKRPYLGPTSTDHELAFLMANQA